MKGSGVAEISNNWFRY